MFVSKDMLIFGLMPEQYFSNKDPNLVINPRKHHLISTHNLEAQPKTEAFEQKITKPFTQSRPMQDYLVISHSSQIYQAFSIFIVLLCILSSFIYAFFAAFRYDTDDSISGKMLFDQDEIVIMNNMEVIIEIIFVVDMATKFFVEYREESTNLLVRDISLISIRYIKNEFIMDLIPLLPLHSFFTFKFSHLLYILKCIRMLKTFQLLDTGRFMKHVKKYYEIQLLKVCEDPALAENRDLDQNKIMRIIMILFGAIV